MADAPKSASRSDADEIIAEVQALVVGLSEQQAIPDDWWSGRLDALQVRIRTALSERGSSDVLQAELDTRPDHPEMQAALLKISDLKNALHHVAYSAHKWADECKCEACSKARAELSER